MNAAPSINGSTAARPMRPGFYDPLADEPETVTVSPSAEYFSLKATVERDS